MSSATPSMPPDSGIYQFKFSNYLTETWGGGIMFITLIHLSAERIQHSKVSHYAMRSGS